MGEIVFVPVATLIVTAVMVVVALLIARSEAREAGKSGPQVREMDTAGPLQKAS